MENVLLSEITRIKSMMGVINESIIPPAVEKLFMRFLMGGAEKNAIKEFLEKGINQLSKTSEADLINLVKTTEGEAYIRNVENEVSRMASGTDRKVAETHLAELKTFKDNVKLKSAEGATKMAEIQTIYSQIRDFERMDFAQSMTNRRVLKDVKTKLSAVKSPKYMKYLEQKLKNDVTALETQIAMKSPKLMDYINSLYIKFNAQSFITKAVIILLAIGTGIGKTLYNKISSGLGDGVETIQDSLGVKDASSGSSSDSTNTQQPVVQPPVKGSLDDL